MFRQPLGETAKRKIPQDPFVAKLDADRLVRVGRLLELVPEHNPAALDIYRTDRDASLTLGALVDKAQCRRRRLPQTRSVSIEGRDGNSRGVGKRAGTHAVVTADAGIELLADCLSQIFGKRIPQGQPVHLVSAFQNFRRRGSGIVAVPAGRS